MGEEGGARDLDDLDRPPRWEPEAVLRRRSINETLHAAGVALAVLSVVMVLGAPLLGLLAGPTVVFTATLGLGYVGWHLADELKPHALLVLVVLLVVVLTFQ